MWLCNNALQFSTGKARDRFGTRFDSLPTVLSGFFRLHECRLSPSLSKNRRLTSPRNPTQSSRSSTSMEVVGRAGLRNENDTQGLRNVAGDRIIVFLGDADPNDLLSGSVHRWRLLTPA